MNLLNEVQKDAKQFAREPRTLLLMLTAPLLVLFIIGAIFGGQSTQTGKSSIGMCDLDQSNTSKFFVDGIQNSSPIVDYGLEGDCAARLEKSVRDGKIAAGFVIPAGYENGLAHGKTQNVSVLLDNSKFQVSPAVEAFIKAAVQETDQKIGTEFILTVWQRLGTASGKLEQILEDLNATRSQAIIMQGRLNSTAASLQALDITKVRNEVYLANGTVEQTVALLNTAEANLTKIESDFADYEVTLKQTEEDLSEIDGTLLNATVFVNSTRSGLNCTNGAFNAPCASLDSLQGRMGAVEQSVKQRLDKVRAARVNLAAANKTIQEFKRDIAGALNASVDAKTRIENMAGFVDELEQNRDGALQTIGDAQVSLEEMVLKTHELEGIIRTSRDQIGQITSQPPEFIISPMVVSSDYLFGERPFFEFMLPSLLPLILMFITLFLSSTSLVREKYNGTLQRVYTSQVNNFEYVIVKILSYTTVLIPEAVLLALVASVFYNAFPLTDLGTWFFVLQPLVLLTLAFVALGVLIAIVSESESTAFLASLVIGLPLLFLSGILFPLEFMPPLVSFFAALSPLTQAVLSMQAVMLYHYFQPVGSVTLLIYTGAFTLLAGLVLKK